MDQNVGVHSVLSTIQKIVGLFKTLINFCLLQFDDLATLMIPRIIGYVKLTNEVRIVIKHPFKLTLEQKLLYFIMYMNHDDMYDPLMWNQKKNVVCFHWISH
jgi:hypothetical protein